MSKSGDVSTELVKGAAELTKAAYGDAIQPGAKEVGKALQTVGRAVNLVLAPLLGVVWGGEKIVNYVSTTVPQILERRKVPAERIQAPDPDVAVPALEALRYSKLRENYAILLATSMDSESANDAHPAFAEILKQLTPDEVKILEFLPRAGLHEPLANIEYYIPDGVGTFTMHRHIGTLGTDSGCEYPEALPKYIDNLSRLGLVEVPALGRLSEDWRYNRIRALEIVQTAGERAPGGALMTNFVETMCGLTNLGSSFRKACTIRPDSEEV